MDYKPLPIGIDDFKTVIEGNYYYVDKTDLIKKILDSASMVTLFTRPRRFGKSLNLSMLRYYFEKNDICNTHLFENFKIVTSGEKYSAHMAKYPVIMLNFKGAKQENFELSYDKLILNIAQEFKRHEHVLKSDELSDYEKNLYVRIMEMNGSMSEYLYSLKFLSECLEKVYQKKAIILIDEYDVPLENAHFRGFYDKMASFIRGVLESALKSNLSLKFSIMTGCLRISKESIFTGLNNLEIISIQNAYYGEYFGFIEKEVEEMLKHYDKSHQMENIKEWYDGYLFGNTDVFNPWSVVNHVKYVVLNGNDIPKPYWSNTSSNDIIKTLIERASEETKQELEELISGGSIEKIIHEDITYAEIYDTSSDDNIWNFLYFTGYMRKVSERLVGNSIHITMKIPNREIAYIYESKIMNWIDEKIYQTDLTKLYTATLSGDTETMQEEINELLEEVISSHDYIESFYHGFVGGLYKGLKGYRIESNREEELGRPDLCMLPVNIDKRAVILEFKITKSPSERENTANIAVEQILKKEYSKGLKTRGYTDIVGYGISFYKKNCFIKSINRLDM